VEGDAEMGEEEGEKEKERGKLNVGFCTWLLKFKALFVMLEGVRRISYVVRNLCLNRNALI
jgi:hypothetical protein